MQILSKDRKKLADFIKGSQKIYRFFQKIVENMWILSKNHRKYINFIQKLQKNLNFIRRSPKTSKNKKKIVNFVEKLLYHQK